MDGTRGKRLAALLLAAACCSALLAAFATASPQRSSASSRHAAKAPRCRAHSRSTHHGAHRASRCRHSHHVAAKIPAGTSKPTSSPTTTNTPGPGETPSTSAAGPTPGKQPAGGGPPVVPRVQVTAVEYGFSLSRTTVPAGKVIVEFVNKGQDEHNLNALGGEGELAGSFENEPASGVKDQTLVLKPGSYTLFCSLPEHEQKGMKATLLVQ
jgi:plastocyanin